MSENKPLSRRRFLAGCAATASASFLPIDFALGQTKASKKNVLFLAVDDLSTRIATYGHPIVKTPNIDRLAAEGVQFNQAYSQFPGCGGSRGSLLTGARPTHTRFHNWDSRISKEMPEAVTLPACFGSQGYYTVSYGKVEHGFYDIRKDWNDSFRRRRQKPLIREETVPFREIPSTETALELDEEVARVVELRIKDLERSKIPFFLSVGFFRPHLPYFAPKKYWDLYSKIEIAKENQRIRKLVDLSEFANYAAELREYRGIPKEGEIPDKVREKLIHGYFACTSYADAQVGRVLDALDASRFRDNTIVVLWTDHSFSLGEHGFWGKGTLLRDQVHTPLIVRAPGFAKNVKVDALTELVDIYPSLCELCALRAPENQLQGDSFVPMLHDASTVLKDRVFYRSEYGKAVLTKDFNYWELPNKKGKLEQVLLKTETQLNEKGNLASLPEYRNIAVDMAEALRKGWRWAG